MDGKSKQPTANVMLRRLDVDVEGANQRIVMDSFCRHFIYQPFAHCSSVFCICVALMDLGG
jgi:hypothetical protein